MNKELKPRNLKDCWFRFSAFLFLNAALYFTIGFLVHGIWLGFFLVIAVILLFTAFQYLFKLFAKKSGNYKRLNLKQNIGLRNLYFELLYAYPKVNIEFWSHYGELDSCIFVEKKFFKSTLVFILSNYDYKDEQKLEDLRQIVLNFVSKPMAENSFLTLHQLSLNSVFAIPLGFLNLVGLVFLKSTAMTRACKLIFAVIQSSKRSLSDWIYNDLPSRQLNSEIWKVVLSGVDFMERRIPRHENIV